jgi:hypothetical protein
MDLVGSSGFVTLQPLLPPLVPQGSNRDDVENDGFPSAGTIVIAAVAWFGTVVL